VFPSKKLPKSEACLPLMLFQSSIRRELARSFGATFVVLITIVLTIVLIRTLGQASRGVVNPQDVVLFMAYAALGRLPTILTLSLFIAIVSTLTRMYRDSEMVVWFTSGRSLASFLMPLFRFAWPVLLIICLTALFVWPWTNQQTKSMQENFGNRSDVDRIAPGQFQESSNGNRVFFIDRDAKADQKSSNNVFISANEKGKSSVTTARSGRIEMTAEKQVLILTNGQRLESENGKATLKISDFEEYGSNTGGSVSVNADASDAKLLSIPVLMKTPSRANLSELAWRLGLALAAVNFVVLALALASVNPRGGRSGNLVFVVLTFLVYNNLVNLGQSWVYSESVSFSGLLLLLHGSVLLLGLLWLTKRNNNWTLRSALRMQVRSVRRQN
jgi:lipopolysaccharide export system permease protein